MGHSAKEICEPMVQVYEQFVALFILSDFLANSFRHVQTRRCWILPQ